MKERKRILYYSEGWGLGGIERFIMNTIEAMNTDVYAFDIFCTHDWNSAYDSEITQLGGRRYTVFKGHKPNLVKRLFFSCRAWYKILKKNKYDIVHINTMNGMGFLYSVIAKFCGVKVRIVHSHNSSFESGSKGIKNLAHFLGKLLFLWSATARLAVSSEAGQFLFGKHNFEIIRNGTDTRRFSYNQTERENIRRRYKVSEKTFVFGSVARLEEAKNPIAQIHILAALQKQGVDAKLMLVGEGSLYKTIISLATDLSVSDRLILPGGTTHPEAFMNTLDTLTMPSTFEGFPMVIIEALSTGLPILLSEEIPRTDIQGIYEKHLPREKTEVWVQELKRIAENMQGLESRKKGSEIIDIAGFSSVETTRKLERIYAGMHKKEVSGR